LSGELALSPAAVAARGAVRLATLGPEPGGVASK
jgi:hypothetical protein